MITRARRRRHGAGLAVALSVASLLAGIAATSAVGLDDKHVPASLVDGQATVWHAQLDYSCGGHDRVTPEPYLLTWNGPAGMRYFWYGENEGYIVPSSGPGYNEQFLNGGTNLGTTATPPYMNIEASGATMSSGSCAKYVFTRTDKGLAQWECNSDWVSLHPIEQMDPWPAMAGGQNEGCYPLFGFLPALPTLAVAEVAPTSDPLTVQVRVKLAHDAKAVSGGCDPTASFSFNDQDLKSFTKVGACTYDLTFKQPGTGVYHVAAHGYLADGANVAVSVDQYGGDVQGGTFPVVIDSCADPSNDTVDVDALANVKDSVCDVVVGKWDPDEASIAMQVIATADGAPGLAIPIDPVKDVDPADWATRKPANNGWLPTGNPAPPGAVWFPLFAHGSGNLTSAIAYVSGVPHPAGVPAQWDGSGTSLPLGRLDDRPPAIVVSAHGAWYTSNGVLRVPAGDTITTYVPIGVSMGGTLGLHVDTGNLSGADKLYRRVYEPGQLIPDFTFLHYPGLTGHHTFDPALPTTLAALVRPNEGAIWIAACAVVYVPAGDSLQRALSSLPVLAPGATDPVGWVSATLTDNGVLRPGATVAAPLGAAP